MTLPLDGVRVLDLSRLLPGPCCSLLRADGGPACWCFGSHGPLVRSVAWKRPSPNST